jgi:hypothetical protein
VTHRRELPCRAGGDGWPCSVGDRRQWFRGDSAVAFEGLTADLGLELVEAEVFDAGCLLLRDRIVEPSSRRAAGDRWGAAGGRLCTDLGSSSSVGLRLRTASTSWVWDALPRRMGSMSSGDCAGRVRDRRCPGPGQLRVVGSGWGLFIVGLVGAVLAFQQLSGSDRPGLRL